jgi:hypothetical protein
LSPTITASNEWLGPSLKVAHSNAVMMSHALVRRAAVNMRQVSALLYGCLDSLPQTMHDLGSPLYNYFTPRVEWETHLTDILFKKVDLDRSIHHNTVSNADLNMSMSVPMSEPVNFSHVPLNIWTAMALLQLQLQVLVPRVNTDTFNLDAQRSRNSSHKLLPGQKFCENHGDGHTTASWYCAQCPQGEQFLCNKCDLMVHVGSQRRNHFRQLIPFDATRQPSPWLLSIESANNNSNIKDNDDHDNGDESEYDFDDEHNDIRIKRLGFDKNGGAPGKEAGNKDVAVIDGSKKVKQNRVNGNDVHTNGCGRGSALNTALNDEIAMIRVETCAGQLILQPLLENAQLMFSATAYRGKISKNASVQVSEKVESEICATPVPKIAHKYNQSKSKIAK